MIENETGKLEEPGSATQIAPPVADVRIILPGPADAGILLSYGTKVFINGLEVRNITQFSLTSAVGGVPTLNLTRYCGPYEVHGQAGIEIHEKCPACGWSTDISKERGDGVWWSLKKGDDV